MVQKLSLIAVAFVVWSSRSYGKIQTSTLPVHDTAMQLLIEQKYDAARSVLARQIEENPLDLTAHYLSFAVEQTRILDYESYIVEEEKFLRLAESTRKVFEKRISTLSGLDSTICLFYLANVFGGIGAILAKTGNWFEGVKNAVNSVSMLKQVKKRQPDFHAADLGLGIFNYYLSTSLKWLPFVENRAKEGLESIELALQADFPYNYAAKNSLCWILIEKQNFSRADSITQSVLDELPDNTIFLRIKALIALWTGNYREAIPLGERLVAITEKRRPLNWSDMVAGYLVLVQGAFETGDHACACAAARKLSKKGIPPEYLEIPHIKKNFRYINGVMNKCRRRERRMQ